LSNKTDYWLELCDDDLITAKVLLDNKRLLHMGYLCHQTAEKALKAVIAAKTDEAPPKIHDLKTLAKRSAIMVDLSEGQLSFLEQLAPLQIEARYPEFKAKIAATLNYDKCQEIYRDTEEFLCWIKQRLGK